MFKIFAIVVSICLTSFVKTEYADEKITINKMEFEKLVERLTAIDKFAKEQAGLIQKQTQLMANQEHGLLELQEEVHQLKAFGRSQKRVMDDHEATIKALRNQCVLKSDIQENKNIVRRQSSDMVVAFSATINRQYVDHIGLHQNIVFSDVITNIGNGYNNHHGVFVAPVSGVYMFTVTLLSSQNAELAAAIEINGTDIVRMFEKGADTRHGSATQTVIVQLRKGDDVSIQSVFSDSHTYWGDKYTSFSGVLLHELEMDLSEIVGRK